MVPDSAWLKRALCAFGSQGGGGGGGGVLRAAVGIGQRGGQRVHPQSAKVACGLQRTSDLCVFV